MVPYDGPWAECKGDSIAKQQEQVNLTASQQQLSFDTQLMSIFQKQYANQSGVLDYLKGKMQPIIDAGGQGYSPEALASLRTSASDQNAIAYTNAQQALQNRITQASGGSKLVGTSGAETEAQAGLLNSKAIADSQAQNTITQANENLKQQNYWNAINVLSGTAAQVNPLGYAGAANNAAGAEASLGNSTASLSQAVTAANQSQLLGALGGIAGGIGSALGGGFTKGGLFGCWVAASFWGWHGLKTWVVRLWMRNEAPAWFRRFYMKHGEWVSSTPLRWAYRPIFETVLAVS